MDKLDKVHPDLVRVVVEAHKHSPIAFRVTEGARHLGRQHKLVRLGYSKTLASKHLIQADGYAHAVDVIAVGDLDGDGDIDAQDTKHTWDPALYGKIALVVKACANELGVKVRWGGDFKNFFDGPHFELVGP